jgi:two-component system, chemotaxis family, chemotaxis protein CheY
VAAVFAAFLFARTKLRALAQKVLQNGVGMRVLIADDQKSVGTTLASLVANCKHEVVEVVGSGLEAIQAYARHHPDVVLMDYWMSKLNGATACRNILAKDPSARVILVSGWSPSNEMIDAGAIAVLAKPVRLERLEQVLNSVQEQPIFHYGSGHP